MSYDPNIRAGSLVVGLDAAALEVTDCAVECTVTWLESVVDGSNLLWKYTLS